MKKRKKMKRSSTVQKVRKVKKIKYNNTGDNKWVISVHKCINEGKYDLIKKHKMISIELRKDIRSIETNITKLNAIYRRVKEINDLNIIKYKSDDDFQNISNDYLIEIDNERKNLSIQLNEKIIYVNQLKNYFNSSKWYISQFKELFDLFLLLKNSDIIGLCVNIDVFHYIFYNYLSVLKQSTNKIDMNEVRDLLNYIRNIKINPLPIYN